MNTYILVPLLMAAVLLPAICALGVAHTHKGVKIGLWFMWVAFASAGFGLWYYAAQTTTLFHGNVHLLLWVAAITNIICFIDALDSPFEPSKPRKSKLALPAQSTTAAKGVNPSKEQPDD